MRNITLRLAFIKWGFTSVLAALPLFFALFKQYLQCGTFDLVKIASGGEFFLVCIVIVAEPLGDLIISRNRGAATLTIVVCSIFIIMGSIYLFSLVDSKEASIFGKGNAVISDVQQTGDTKNKEMKQALDVTKNIDTSKNVLDPTHLGAIINMVQDIMKQKENANEVNFNEIARRIMNITRVFFISSLILGGAAILQSHLEYIK